MAPPDDQKIPGRTVGAWLEEVALDPDRAWGDFLKAAEVVLRRVRCPTEDRDELRQDLALRVLGQMAIAHRARKRPFVGWLRAISVLLLKERRRKFRPFFAVMSDHRREDTTPEIAVSDTEIATWVAREASRVETELPWPYREIFRIRLSGGTHGQVAEFLRNERGIRPDRALELEAATMEMAAAVFRGENPRKQWPRRFS